MKTNRFLDEIFEQPDALNNTLDYYVQGEGKEHLGRAIQLTKENKFSRVIFTGMGSSFFISGMASTIMNRYGIPSQAINTGELIHYHLPVISRDTLLICTSQSGESFEIIHLMESLPDDIKSIAICNEPESTLARLASLVLLSKAGKEFMTSTKTFSSEALVAVIMVFGLTGQWTDEKVIQVRSVIRSADNLITYHASWLKKAMNFFKKSDYIQLVGRGPSMAAAKQGALMFMEGAQKPASALFSGEFRHGPMEIVKKGFLIIILAPEGETLHLHLKLAEDILHFGGSVIFLGTKDPGVNSREFLYINIPCADENLFSIPAIVPLQFIVNECAVLKGSIPGIFSRGSKVTTIE